MEGDRPGSAEIDGRICSICLLPQGDDMDCQSCCHIANRLTELHYEYSDTSLIIVIEALKEWSQDARTWDILYWLNQLLQPSSSRGRRMTGPRQGLFIVFEGIDGSGKKLSIWMQLRKH